MKTITKKIYFDDSCLRIRCLKDAWFSHAGSHFTVIILHVIHILNKKAKNDLNNIIPDIFHYFKAKTT